jgi:uncharacterized membrane protein
MNPTVWFLIVVGASLLVTIVWMYFFIHAMQWTEDPVERMEWVLAFVAFTIFAVVVYYFMRYRKAKAEGRGHLIRRKS